jgi:putative ABC transport system permease protein
MTLDSHSMNSDPVVLVDRFKPRNQMMEILVKELKQASRILRRKPVATATSIVILAIGIAVASAAFSAVQAGLLNDLPYPEHDRLVLIHGKAVRTDNVPQWEGLSHSYQQIAFLAPGTGDVSSGTGMLEATTAMVSEHFFSMLGVQAATGRLFSDADFRVSPNVAVVSDSFADKHFGSRNNAIGQLVTLDGVPLQVIGVLAAHSVPLPYPPIDVWLPLVNVRAQYADGIAVLRKGITATTAQAEAAMIARRLSGEGRPAVVTVTGLKGAVVRDSKLTLLLVMAATILLLIIMCSNTASLMLVQLASREKELAIRAALGASQSRLLRQLFGEALVVAMAATAVAMPISLWLIKSIETVYPANMRLSEASLTGSVIAFIFLGGIGASVVICGVVFVTARHFTSFASLTERMIARRLSNRRGVFPVLVAAEVAVTTTLLIGTGLLVESFIKLAPFKPGFEYSHRVVFRVILPDNPVPDAARSHLRTVVDDLGRVPGVTGVTAISDPPLADTTWVPDIWIDGNLVAGRRSSAFVYCHAAVGNFFQILDIPIVEGHSFGVSAAREPYAVVNQAFVQRFAPARPVLGERVAVEIDGRKVGFTIVGVTRNVRMFSDTTVVEPELYMPIGLAAIKRMSLIAEVRDASDPAIARLQTTVEKSNGANSVIMARRLEQVLSAGIRPQRTRAIMFGIIAAIAVLLATAGIYGVLSWSIAAREREIGVRTALGAQPRQIMGLVLRQAMAITALGMISGIAGALAGGRAMAPLLYNTKPTDALTISLASSIILAASAIASAFPAHRATRVDPMVAMKAE